MIGHASLLVEAGDCTILFDPILHDPNQDDCFSILPTRLIRIEDMPAADVIIVSHRHLDHFDVRSLQSLSRSADVICPEDDIVATALRDIGYRHVFPSSAWQTIRYAGVSITMTPSRVNVPELGAVIDVENGGFVFWNQVDTLVDESIIERVKRRWPRLDLVCAPWQPMQELAFQTNERLSFPHDQYRTMIDLIAQSGASAVIPGASGLRYQSPASWLNRIVFPATRERLVRDLGNAVPSLARTIYALDPGDCLEADGAHIAVRAQSSPFVETICNDAEAIDYCPVDPYGLIGSTDDSVMSGARVEQIIRSLESWLDDRSEVSEPYRRSNVVFQVFVRGRNSTIAYAFDFSRSPLTASEGRNPLATVCTIISYSALIGLDDGSISWERVMHTGNYGTFSTAATVSLGFYAVPDKYELVDILRAYYPYERSLRALVKRELER